MLLLFWLWYSSSARLNVARSWHLCVCLQACTRSLHPALSASSLCWYTCSSRCLHWWSAQVITPPRIAGIWGLILETTMEGKAFLCWNLHNPTAPLLKRQHIFNGSITRSICWMLMHSKLYLLFHNKQQKSVSRCSRHWDWGKDGERKYLTVKCAFYLFIYYYFYIWFMVFQFMTKITIIWNQRGFIFAKTPKWFQIMIVEKNTLSVFWE